MPVWNSSGSPIRNVHTIEADAQGNVWALATDVGLYRIAGGTVKLEDVIEGITVHQEKNKVTGLTERVIIEHRAERLHPQVAIIKGGKRVAGTTDPRLQAAVTGYRGYVHGQAELLVKRVRPFVAGAPAQK